MSNTRDRVAVAKAQTDAGAVKNKTVLDLIQAQQPAIRRALPSGMSAERFTRIALTEVRRNPKLAACDPYSLLGALMISAQLGLEPGPLGHAYLVPFGKECTLIVGYKGMIDLARRSGNISSIVAREVCENDEFDYAYGLDDYLRHKPTLTDRGKVIAYYAIAKYQDGGHTFLVLSPDEVEKYKKRSKARGDGPWVTDYEAMAKKTAVRRLAAFLPLTVEAARALEVDEQTIDFDLARMEVVEKITDTPDTENPEEAEEAEEAELVADDENG